MKIVKRSEFLKLPAGTLFAEYEPCVFGCLEIKGDSLSNDWFEQRIVDAIDANDSGQFADMLFNAEKSGASLPMNFYCEGRNGAFEPPERLYAVFERQDVEALIERLQDAVRQVGKKDG